jgi:hypothetical protein
MFAQFLAKAGSSGESYAELIQIAAFGLGVFALLEGLSEK